MGSQFFDTRTADRFFYVYLGSVRSTNYERESG